MSFNFAEVSDRIVDLNGKIGEIETAAAEKTKDLKQQVKDLEEQLLLAMTDAGVTTIKGSKSEAEIKDSVKISIADYDAFETFLYRKKALHLLQRRISDVAYREVKSSLGDKPVPGLSEFTLTKINVKPAKGR